MNSIVKRYIIFIIGLIINAFGITFITKSALGTSPISGVPYVFSLKFTDLSFGIFTFIINFIFVILEIILLRNKFKPIQLLQLVATFIFSSFIDIWMFILSDLNPNTLLLRLMCLIFGCMILAFGICVEVAPNVLVVPGEGMVRVISYVLKSDFGKTKTCFDVTLMITAAVFSFIFFGKLNGLGIGTVISAVVVGQFVSLFNRKFTFLKALKA